MFTRIHILLYDLIFYFDLFEIKLYFYAFLVQTESYALLYNIYKKINTQETEL
jgi:hypothetical protein